jgi:hypothetical protein
MNCIDFESCLRWLASYGYRYEERQKWPISDSEYYYISEIYVELPEFAHVLTFEPSQIIGSTLDLYERLVNWLDDEKLFLFQMWDLDCGASKVRFEGSLIEYVEAICPGQTEIRWDGGGLVWDSNDPGRIAQIFDDFFNRNWQAYALSGTRSSVIWLADEVIDIRTNDASKFADIQARIRPKT